MDKIHDNELIIDLCKFSIKEIREIEHKITNGQDYGGVYYRVDDRTCTITVKAGRKGSEDVASYFNNLIPVHRCIATKSSALHPQKLNFAVQLRFILVDNNNIEFSISLIIAQGHNSNQKNNWWIGGDEFYETLVEDGQRHAIMLPRESKNNYALPILVEESGTYNLSMVFLP